MQDIGHMLFWGVSGNDVALALAISDLWWMRLSKVVTFEKTQRFPDGYFFANTHQGTFASWVYFSPVPTMTVAAHLIFSWPCLAVHSGASNAVFLPFFTLPTSYISNSSQQWSCERMKATQPYGNCCKQCCQEEEHVCLESQGQKILKGWQTK